MHAENSGSNNRPLSTEMSGEIKAQITELLRDIHTQTNVPGLGVALSINGQCIETSVGVAAVGTDEPFDINAQFQLGCITKLLTCAVAADLIDKDLLDKEAFIGTYLNDFADCEKGKTVAVWHLMSHTSGFQGLNLADTATAYYYQWPTFIDFFRNTPQLFSPGSVFSYDHSECVLLGEIIKRITGQTMTGLLQERLFKPLNIQAGDIRNLGSDPKRFAADHLFNPDSKMFSKARAIPYGPFWHSSLSPFTLSLPEQVKIGESIIGISQPAAPFPARNAMEFVQKQVIKLPNTIGSRHPEQLPGAFGVGCAAYRGWLLGHNGSARGQTCGLRFDPKNKLVLAVGINSWQPFLRDKIINHIFGALRGQAIIPAPGEPVEYELAQLSGRYIGPVGLECNVAAAKDKLHCEFVSQSASQKISILLKQDAAKNLIAATDALHHSVGFFRNPDNDDPCLMFGLVALRKVA
jgi:CubicO group peptidase (beta-lactamase class C family)